MRLFILFSALDYVFVSNNCKVVYAYPIPLPLVTLGEAQLSQQVQSPSSFDTAEDYVFRYTEDGPFPSSDWPSDHMLLVASVNLPGFER